MATCLMHRESFNTKRGTAKLLTIPSKFSFQSDTIGDDERTCCRRRAPAGTYPIERFDYYFIFRIICMSKPVHRSIFDYDVIVIERPDKAWFLSHKQLIHFRHHNLHRFNAIVTQATLNHSDMSLDFVAVELFKWLLLLLLYLPFACTAIKRVQYEL